MRPGVRELHREAMLVFDTKAGLKRVITRIGGLFFLGDTRIAEILSELVRIDCTSRNIFSRRKVTQRESVDRAIIVLMPTRGPHILEYPHNGRSKLSLRAKAEHGNTRGRVVVCQVCDARRKDGTRRCLAALVILRWIGKVNAVC